MNLTKKNKRIIFWALVDKYTEFEKARKQARRFFEHDKTKLETTLNMIDTQEKEHYKLMAKFSKELDIKIPEIEKS